MARHQSVLDQLARQVHRLRKDRGWSRRELSAQTKISERFLADIERGNANPSVARLCDLAAALGTSASSLLACSSASCGPAVALLGLRGAGKSAVGVRLSELLDVPLVELDAQVEATAGMSLTEIFQLHGEGHYRRLEATVVRELLHNERPQIIATGGGIVAAPATFEYLKTHAHTVWLQARAEDHWSRVVAQGDTRPMADNEQAFQDLCTLLEEREHYYRQAEITLPTSGRTVDELARELALHFAYLPQPS